MLKNISDDIACLLVKKRIVSNEKREMYSYGMEVILLNSLNLLIALFISLFSSTISHFVVFVLVFIPLRMSIGGYHAKTSGSCAIISTLLYIATIVIQNRATIKAKFIILLTGFVISILLILIYAPVEHKNNPLRTKLKKRNRLIALFLVGIDSITVMICYAIAPHIASSIMIFVILAGILMLLGLLPKSNTTNYT